MKSITNFLVICSIVCSFALSAIAGQTECPEHFVDGQTPDLINQKLSAMARDVCYSGYALKHSGITRTPLYAAEHLTRDRLIFGKGLKRQSQFHPDEHIPATERAELQHYARSGYDRGHVAPSGDMFDIQSQQESFTLANMVPQVAAINRGPWEGIESGVRRLTETTGELYVVTGPIFKGDNIQRVGGAVMVPTQMFKAIYDPKKKQAGAYLIDNAENATPQHISITDLENQTGISIFPSINKDIKSNLMELPELKSYKERKGKRT
jgi:endonuclease G